MNRRRYITVQGDMWDLIAFTQLGDVAHTDKIMNLNQQHRETYIFPAGVELVLPDIDPDSPDTLPPWRQVVG